MKTIQEYLGQKHSNFIHHPFFNKITISNNLQHLIYIRKHLSVWIVSFQYLLRLNEMQINDTQLYHIAQHRHMDQHRRIKDAAHDNLFLKDLEEISSEQPNLELLYIETHTYTRYATYALISEVFRARNDYQRIALSLTIELAADIFLQYIVNFAERINFFHFKCFLKHHLEVEKNHELLEQEIKAYLETIQLDQDTQKDILEMIDRVYDHFILMFDGITENLDLKPSASRATFSPEVSLSSSLLLIAS